MSQGCATWRDELGAYVIGALDGEERAATRRHLAACPACRTDYEDLLPVRDWLTRTKRHLAACPAWRDDVRRKIAMFAVGLAERQGRSAKVQILIRYGRHVDESLVPVWAKAGPTQGWPLPKYERWLAHAITSALCP